MKFLTCAAFFTLFTLSLLFAQDNIIKVNFNGGKFDNAKVKFSEINSSKIRLSVTDNQGAPIENLNREDIKIIKNGCEQEILSVIPLVESENSRFNIVLCLDNSTSMSEHSKRLLGIVDTLLSSFTKGVNVTTVFFDDTDRLKQFKVGNDALKVDLRKFGNDFTAVKQYCQKLYDDELTPRTCIYDQIYAAFIAMSGNELKAEDLFFIILSDGVDNASMVNKADVFKSYSKGNVFLIGFTNTWQNPFLKDLSEKIQANYYTAENADELAIKFAQIGKRIVFSGYEVTYKEVFPPELKITGFYRLKNAQYIPIDKLKLEEVNSREFFPLLNYVFFEKGSSKLDSKYSSDLERLKKSGQAFNEINIAPRQLEIYNNLLNVVASRMQKFTEANLILTGCNDNEGAEKNNKLLSQNRAEIVRNYIINNYNIDPNRITVKVQNLPQKPSTLKNPAGLQENRRVEIYSNDERILEPVEILAQTNFSDPEILSVGLDVKSSSPVTNWKFIVDQSSENIISNAENGFPPEHYNWQITPSLYDKKLDGSDFIFSVSAEDAKGLQSGNVIKKLPVEYVSSEKKKIEKLNDKLVEKLSLVLFDFNSSKLDKRNQNILKRVENSLSPFSSLKMNGYTDSLGTEEANMKLSKERASAALKELIRILKPKSKMLESEGFGEKLELYDNSLPEGRFYNRTCQLIIETPAKTDEITIKETGNKY
ncbi:MAG: OmpA family protein [Clostridiales bacterium]